MTLPANWISTLPLPEAPAFPAPLAFMGGYQEVLIILVVVLLLFGARKLPELARSMGSSITMFKKGLHEGADEKAGELPSASSAGGASTTPTGDAQKSAD